MCWTLEHVHDALTESFSLQVCTVPPHAQTKVDLGQKPPFMAGQPSPPKQPPREIQPYLSGGGGTTLVGIR